MARQSTIFVLPKEIKQAINDLRNQGRTLDDIVEHLKKLDVKVSRSSLHRHVQKIERVGEKIRKSREIAEAIVKQYGDPDFNKTSRLNIEFLHSMILDAMAGSEDGENISLTPQQIMFLAKSLNDLSRAKKTDAELIEQERKLEREKAAKEAVKAAKSEGITDDTVNKIKISILGVKNG